MALTDLADLDLLDATLARLLPKEYQEDLLSTYLEAYAMVLTNALEGEFKPKDNEDMQKLLQSPDVDAEKIEKFYLDRIPHFQAKITLMALEFKKRFLLDVYKNKVQEYQSSKNKQGYEAWKQIYVEAQLDNWNEVNRYLKLVDSMEK